MWVIRSSRKTHTLHRLTWAWTSDICCNGEVGPTALFPIMFGIRVEWNFVCGFNELMLDELFKFNVKPNTCMPCESS